MALESSTATTRAARPAKSLRDATIDPEKNEMTTEQSVLDNDFVESDSTAAQTTTKPPWTADTESSSDDDDESAGDASQVKDNAYHYEPTRVKNENVTPSEKTIQDSTSVTDIEAILTSLDSTQKENSDESNACTFSALPENQQAPVRTFEDLPTQTSTIPEELATSPDELSEEATEPSGSGKALEVNTTSRVDPGPSFISTETASPSNLLSCPEDDLADSTGRDAKKLQLLHFYDDLSEYDGDALWICILNRCVEWFNDGQARLGPAYLALQKLRLGKCNAETAFKELCDISNYEPDRCSLFQSTLGVLEHYPGSSLLQAPFVTFSNSGKVYLTKPQESCLTCIKHDEGCRGTKITDGRCETCHHKKLNAPPGVQVDECRWEDPKFGIFTWGDAELLLGSSNNGTSSQKSGLKRKASDQLTSTRSKKLNSNARSAGLFVQVPGLGLQPRYIQQPSRIGDGLLPFLSLRLETKVRTTTSYVGSQHKVVSTNEWRTVKAAFLWNTWQSIRSLRQTRQFTERPTYTFSIKRRTVDKEKLIDDVDLLWLDREIRSGKLERFKTMASWIFVCTVRPAEKTI